MLFIFISLPSANWYLMFFLARHATLRSNKFQAKPIINLKLYRTLRSEFGCWIPVSHMVMLFQYITWWCTCSFSHRFRISVSSMAIKRKPIRITSLEIYISIIPVSHIVVEFQCLTLLWNSSVSHELYNCIVSHSCGIPVTPTTVDL